MVTQLYYHYAHKESTTNLSHHHTSPHHHHLSFSLTPESLPNIIPLSHPSPQHYKSSPTLTTSHVTLLAPLSHSHLLFICAKQSCRCFTKGNPFLLWPPTLMLYLAFNPFVSQQKVAPPHPSCSLSCKPYDCLTSASDTTKEKKLIVHTVIMWLASGKASRCRNHAVRHRSTMQSCPY